LHAGKLSFPATVAKTPRAGGGVKGRRTRRAGHGCNARLAGPVHSIEQERPRRRRRDRRHGHGLEHVASHEVAEYRALPARRLLRRSRAPWWELPPLASTDALKDIGHKLGSAPDPEMAIEGRHVLMGRGVAQAETIRDLLLAVPL